MNKHKKITISMHKIGYLEIYILTINASQNSSNTPWMGN